jgi:uncharacterized protein (DUF1778 family)
MKFLPHLPWNDFSSDTLPSTAAQAVEQEDQVRMGMADQEALAKALISPSKPNAAIKRAFANAERLLSA